MDRNVPPCNSSLKNKTTIYYKMDKTSVMDSGLYDNMKVKTGITINVKDGVKTIKSFPSGWAQLKKDETRPDDESVMIITGRKNDIMVIDLDISKKEGEIDGVAWWIENFGPLEDLNTLISKTPSGGFHIFFKYNSKICKSTAKFNSFGDSVAVDIRSDGGVIFEGIHYPLFNDSTELLDLPDKFIKLFNQDKKMESFEGRVEGIETTLITEILDSLNEEYYNRTFLWRKVLVIIKNNDYPFETALTFSKKSEHYQNDEWILKEWNKIEKGKVNLNLGTLLFFLKESVSKNRYDSLLKKINKNELPTEETEFNILVEIILEDSRTRRLKKDLNHIYIRDKTNLMLYKKLYPDHQIESITQYIQDVIGENPLFNNRASHYPSIKVWFETRNRDDFQNIKYNRRLMSFQNGVLNIETMDFIKNEDISKDTLEVARNHIPLPFTPENLETPIFDKTINFQLPGKDRENLYNILLAQIGRLFYPLRNDRLDCILTITGKSSTFKSGTGRIVKKMFREGSVGTINSTQEQVFGLESLFDKEVIIAFDLPGNLGKFLKDDIYKAFADGGTLNIARKNKSALSIEWTTPSFLIKNPSGTADYADNGGAISKRECGYAFNNQVEKTAMDSDLADEIINEELASLFYKCIIAYKQFTKENRKTFESCRPEYFEENIERDLENQSSLYQFLNTEIVFESHMKTTKIVFNDDARMTPPDFKTVFKTWCISNGFTFEKKLDEGILKKMGLKVEKVMSCKYCRNRHSSNCCEKSSRTGRTSTNYIIGLEYLDEIKSNYY